MAARVWPSCVVGYADVGQRLLADLATKEDGNPYAAWIETYTAADYGEAAHGAVLQLDRVVARRIGPEPEAAGRQSSLVDTFRAATRLETGFWGMGMAPARD